VVVGSYVNHAFVMGNDVHVVYPMFVKSYQFGDIRGKAGPPSPALARQIMEETHRFVQSPALVPAATPSGGLPAAAAPH
jgi:hypothetical protein